MDIGDERRSCSADFIPSSQHAWSKGDDGLASGCGIAVGDPGMAPRCERD